MAVQAGSNVYLFEFKAWEKNRSGAALEHLKQRDYAAKYRHLEATIYLVGMEFNVQTRNVEAFETELA